MLDNFVKNIRVIIWVCSLALGIYAIFVVAANRYYGKHSGLLKYNGRIVGDITIFVGPAFIPHFSGIRKTFPYFDIIAIGEVRYDINDTSGEIVDKICWKSNRADTIDSYYYLFDNDMCVWGGKFNIVTFRNGGPNQVGFGDEKIAYLDIISR